MRCHAPRPRLESARRVEARMRAVHPPEGLDCHILCRARIAHDAKHPAENRPLMCAEKRLEGVHVALPKPVEDAASLVPHLQFPFLTSSYVQYH